MKTFNVKQVVLCEVRVWSMVDAEHFNEALDKVAKIEHPTDRGNGYYYDHEVISDKEVISAEIKEEINEN